MTTIISNHLTEKGVIEELNKLNEGEGKKIYRSLHEDEVRNVINLAFKDIDSEIIDYHAHLIGLGTNSNCVAFRDGEESYLFSILRYAQTKMLCQYFTATKNENDFDVQYIERFKFLISDIKQMSHFWGRHYILAFDAWHNENGEKNMNNTGIYVPNDYMMDIVQKNPEIFIPCISVHPYRKDAIDELQKYAARGVRMIKWLPNVMGIDLENPLCENFYRKCIELKMILLIHTGDERSIIVQNMDNNLGNPLKLRVPLNLGVIVIAAHCASDGKGVDLDYLRKTGTEKMDSNFRLLLRLLDEEKYASNLFCDISSLTVLTRIGDPLTTMLDRTDLHPRLVFGTDYPLPVFNFTIHTWALWALGYITFEEKKLLNIIFDENPLLFDFVTKRLLKSPKTGKKFSPSIFGENPKLRYSRMIIS
jgi:hypothetical protein